MPTSRGWAAAGVSGALLLLWAGFGEIELLATALFLLLAVLGGVAFVRAGTARLEVDRRIYPAQSRSRAPETPAAAQPRLVGIRPSTAFPGRGRRGRYPR